MQITTCSDASGRSVTFSDKKFLATSFAGLLPIAHIARSLGLFKNAKEVISAAVPCKCNTQYSPQVMFEQRVKAAQTAVYEKGLKHVKRKEVKRYTAAGTAVQIIGGVSWNAKSWKQKRRVIARKRFDSRTCQLDLRLIQTSIINTMDPQHNGYAGELSLASTEDMYEQVYCGRGRMEQWIGEFKTECFGDRASATKFHTNCYRMILSAYCQMLLKIARRAQYFGVRKANKKAVQKTVRTFRRDVICVTAAVKEMSRELRLTLPEHLHDRQAFEALFSIRI